MTLDTLTTGQDFNPLTDFTGTILESFWSNPMAQSEGEQTDDWAQKSRLYWLLRVDDIHQPDFDDDVESLTIAMGVGKDWEFDESGRYLSHPKAPADDLVLAGKAKPKLISPSSHYGRFLDLCTGKEVAWAGGMIVDTIPREGMDAIVANLTDVGNWLRTHGLVDARDATIWKGLQLTFRGAKLVYRARRGEEPVDVDDLRYTALPVALCAVPENTAGQVVNQAQPAQQPAPTVLDTPAYQAAGGPQVQQTPAVDQVVQALQQAAAAQAPQAAYVEGTAEGAVPASVSGRDQVLQAAQAAGADAGTLNTLTALANAAANHGEFVRNASLVLAGQDHIVAAIANDPGTW